MNKITTQENSANLTLAANSKSWVRPIVDRSVEPIKVRYFRWIVEYVDRRQYAFRTTSPTRLSGWQPEPKH